MASGIPPVDSAFVSGSLVLSHEGRAAADVASEIWQASTLATVMGAVCIILSICFLKKIVNILPSILACFVRKKEIYNLENSRKLALDRDITALVSIPTFCFIVSCYRLYSPSFLENASISENLLATTGIFLAYVLIRFIAVKIVFGRKDKERLPSTAIHCPFTFFILTAWFVVICAGIVAVFGLSSQIFLWGIGLIYIVFLLREMQILLSFCSLFSTFLYLCALEFLPTGALIASAIML